MFELIKRIQQRPENERQTIAFWAALTLTVVIAVLWGVSLVVRMGTSETPRSRTEESGPLKTLGSGVSEGVEALLTSFRSIGK